METTFKIEGPARTQGSALGTGFIIVRPSKTDADKGFWTLVTAHHVLNNIKGETAIIHLRKRNLDGSYIRFPYAFRIRNGSTNLYSKHSTADIAAMTFSVPIDAVPTRAINTNWFATDDVLKTLEVHPGDELFSLGFPLGAEANDAGFPILRSGRIASYPILPTKSNTLLFDFNVFGGNSGGPVYFAFYNRFYGNATHISINQKLFGIVVQQVFSNPNSGNMQRLGLSLILPATLILEVVESLSDPAPDKPAFSVPAGVTIPHPNSIR